MEITLVTILIKALIQCSSASSAAENPLFSHLNNQYYWELIFLIVSVINGLTVSRIMVRAQDKLLQHYPE